MRLGLYGGAFNPIHRCHLLVAETAQARLGLDRVLFIPSGDPPHKPPSEVISAAHRLAMVRLAITSHPSFQASDIEATRPSKSYTIDSVRELLTLHPPDTGLTFIVGLDAFREIASWREPDHLLELCDFAVVSRPGHQFKSLENLPILGIADTDSLRRLDVGHVEVLAVRLKNGRSLMGLPMPPCNVSARDIRTRLKQNQSLENLLPASVESYILSHHLYSGGSPQ